MFHKNTTLSMYDHFQHVPIVLASLLLAQAAAYVEPASFHLAEPLPPTVPSLSIGTAYCEEKPYCCIPGLDYVKLYSDLHCPRLSFNVTVSGQQLSSQHNCRHCRPFKCQLNRTHKCMHVLLLLLLCRSNSYFLVLAN